MLISWPPMKGNNTVKCNVTIVTTLWASVIFEIRLKTIPHSAKLSVDTIVEVMFEIT